MTGADGDPRLVDLVEHVHDLDVGELVESVERVRRETVVDDDLAEYAAPVVVERFGAPPRTTPIGAISRPFG